MPQQADARTQHVGVFLNLSVQRRVDFQTACGDQFGRLFVAEDIEQAEHILSQQHVDLLIVDLERFDRAIDLGALGQMIKHRHVAPLMLVCPFASAGWLAELMAFGQVDYVIGPVTDAELSERLAAHFQSAELSGDAGAGKSVV